MLQLCRKGFLMDVYLFIINLFDNFLDNLPDKEVPA